MVTLTSTVPGAPRVETIDYSMRGTVWGRPHAPPRPSLQLPDLDSADANPTQHHDEMLNVAAAVRGGDPELEMLCASPLHVRELALVVATQDLAIIDLRESLHAARQQTCNALNQLADRNRQLAECRAMLSDAQTLRVAAQRDAEEHRARAIRLSEQVCAMIRPPREPEIVHVSPLVRLTGYDTDEPDTVVCEMEGAL